MFDPIHERRQFIRSRADVEFQLARITLALSRAPIARRTDVGEWFDEAASGLMARTAEEHRDYVEERVAGIRDTFFGDVPIRARDTPDRGPRRMH